MAQFTLPQIPNPGDIKTPVELANYIKQLVSTLSQWQLILNNTKFLGSAVGHLTISEVAPTTAQGHDQDVWIKH